MDTNDQRLRAVRKSLLERDHGTVEEQKNALVAEIVCMFSDPEKWPMTDAERIETLKRWYRMAINIRNTE